MRVHVREAPFPLGGVLFSCHNGDRSTFRRRKTMKRREYRAELGVRKLERYVETKDFQGRKEVVETVAEYVGIWEGPPTVYRYAVHWLFDYDTLDFEDYDKFPANNEAARYGRISIPQDLWRSMQGMVVAFLLTEQVRKILTESISIKPETDARRVTISFRKRQWSGFTLTYAQKRDGEIILMESRNTSPARGERARRGHSRIPRVASELAYDVVVRYFGGLPLHHERQRTLDLSIPSTLIP